MLVTILDRLRLRTRLRNLLLDLGLRSWTPLVPEREFTDSCRTAVRALRGKVPDAEIGDYLEFGVSRGTSLACMSKVLAGEGLSDVRIIGFDSFEGLPPEAEHEGWAQGDFRSTLVQTRTYLARKQVDLDRVTLVPGWFNETLTDSTRDRIGLERAGIVMVDCDIYSASKDALRFCAPLIDTSAVIIFDDWGSLADDVSGDRPARGQREAFAEFLAARDDLTAVPLPSYRPESRIFLLTSGRGQVTTSANRATL